MCHGVRMSYSLVFGSKGTRRAFRPMLALGLCLGLAMSAACGEETPEATQDNSPINTPPPTPDAGAENPWEDYVPPPYTPPAETPTDAGGEFPEEPVDGPDASEPPPEEPPPVSEPPPVGGGKWTLNADSAPECPEEPPPIPIIGGVCFGFYWPCGWTNEAGQVYSCICDLVHYLCI